jgi:hypothetical protein
VALRYTWADSDTPVAVELQYPMVADFSDDFESGGLASWPTVTGNAAVDTLAADLGLYGLRIDPGGGTAATVATSTVKWTQDHGWGLAWCRFRLDELATTGSMDLFTLRNTAGAGHADFFVHSAGNFWLDLVGGSSEVDTGIPADVGVWHTLALRVQYGDTTHRAWISLDGTEFDISQSGATPSYVRSLHLGTTSTTKDYRVSFDDVGVVVADSDPGLSAGDTWHDVTEYLSDEGWSLTRGLTAEGNAADPQHISFTLQNDVGQFTVLHPESPLYGLAGRSTPCRLRTKFDGTWYTRFAGEVASWELSWGLKGAPSSIVRVEAAGVMRRLGRGEESTRSSLYRGLVAADEHLISYWPMEDGKFSTEWTCARGGPSGQITGTPAPAGHDEFWASDPIATIGTSRNHFTVAEYTDTGQWQVRCLAYLPADTPTGSVILSAQCHGGTIASIGVVYRTGGVLTPTVTYSDGTTYTFPDTSYDIDASNIMMSLEVAQAGADVEIRISTVEQGHDMGTTKLRTATTQTVGRIVQVIVNPWRAALYYLAAGHLQVWDQITSLYAYAWELRAWDGESAVSRITGLSTEEGEPATIVGDDGTSCRMGKQSRKSVLDLITEAATVGRGLLYESRTTGGIAYRALAGIVNQESSVTIAYTDNLVVPLKMTSDDRYTLNRVVVTREDGASATVEDSTGPMGTRTAPAGVGVYSDPVTLSLAVDAQARQQAGWSVGLGTTPGARWPSVGVNLAHPTIKASGALTTDLLNLDVGDRLDITGLPDWLPPDPVEGVVLGYTETADAEDYKIVFVLAPYAPYRVAVATTGGGDGSRWTNGSTTTTVGLTSTETDVDITSARPPYWTDADGDYDVAIGGEVMTVTAVTGTGPAQTMTVVRSVNGVVKAHSSGARVGLAEPQHWGLGQ